MPGAADQRSARRARLTGAACLLLAMAAPPGPAGAATGAVVTAAEPVPGAYIVTLAGRDKAAPAATARSLARRAGGRVSHVYTRALRGFAVTGIGEAEAARLAADPAVARVEQDAVVRATATEPGAPWGLDRIDQRA